MQSGLDPPASSTLQPSVSLDTSCCDPSKKKKKKRSHDDVNTDARHSDAPKEKKKKRKHHDDSSSGNTPVAITADQTTTATIDPSKQERKKKKKDKGKSKDTSIVPTETSNVLDPQISAETMDAEAQASTAALLSAIVAAATGGSPDMLGAPPPHQIDPPYPPLLVPGPQPHFISMGPEQHHPYPLHPHMHPVPDPVAFTSMGLPFSDLSFGSNEDVLRALQDLDITKIANVLKTLGEAAAAANVPPLEAFQPVPMFLPPMDPPPQPPTPVGGFPAPSNAILGIPPKRTPCIRVVHPTPNVPEQHGNPDHATLLATRWLGAAKLAELVRTEGLVYKKGKFSAIEEQLLRDAIDNYTSRRGMSEEELQEIIFPPKGIDKGDTIEFWQEITSAVPLRPIIAVYHHVRRTHHPLKQQGKWSEEEDIRLKQAVAVLGQAWEKVSLRVGRMSSDCRDRYRNHIQNREVRVTGPWSKEEEELLTRIVTDMTIKQGKDIDNDVFWGKVSEFMGGRRGRQQCRIKWTDALSKTIKNEGEKPRWSQQDAFILVHKVDSLGVRDDTEIDWKTLSDPDWNLWSAHTLQRRWLTMKRSIKGFENMTHAEIMDILRVKKAHLPLPPLPTIKKRKERKVTSAAAISDVDSMSRSADTTRAGSESNPVSVDTDTDEDEDESSEESSDSE